MGRSTISRRILSHLSHKSLSRRVSQEHFRCHMSGSKILAQTVTGVAHPKGSYIWEESWRILRLDTKLLEGNGFGARDIVSVAVFHFMPSILTVVLQSMVWSLVATCRRAALFDAHDRRLNPALRRILHE